MPFTAFRTIAAQSAQSAEFVRPSAAQFDINQIIAQDPGYTTVPFRPPIYTNVPPIRYYPPIDIGPYQPQPQPQPPAPAPPPTVSSNLQTLLAYIPIAHDGDVHTAQHHNTLRDVAFAMAREIGGAGLSASLILTLPPNMYSREGSPGWTELPTQANATPVASGWIPVELSDGAQIASLTVFNQRGRRLDSLKVELRRLLLSADPAQQPPITMASVIGSADDGTTVHSDTAPVSNPQFTGSAADDLKRVDNGKYRYFINAESTVSGSAEEAHGQTTASIFAFQIGYTQF
jgi:hypothetical protein